MRQHKLPRYTAVTVSQYFTKISTVQYTHSGKNSKLVPSLFSSGTIIFKKFLDAVEMEVNRGQLSELPMRDNAFLITANVCIAAGKLYQVEYRVGLAEVLTSFKIAPSHAFKPL